jgi:hypothetical protein
VSSVAQSAAVCNEIRRCFPQWLQEMVPYIRFLCLGSASNNSLADSDHGVCLFVCVILLRMLSRLLEFPQ